MKNAIYIITVIIFAVLKTTVLSGVQLFGASADLLLAFTVFVALNDGSVFGGCYGLLCGFIADALVYGRFGYNTLFFMYIGVGIGIFKEHFFSSNVFVAFLCSFLASFVHSLLYFIFAHYIYGGVGFWYVFATRILLGSVLTSSFTAIIYLVNLWIAKKNERKGLRRRYGF